MKRIVRKQVSYRHYIVAEMSRHYHQNRQCSQNTKTYVILYLISFRSIHYFLHIQSAWGWMHYNLRPVRP